MTLPLSDAVGPLGRVVALDIQDGMLERLAKRLESQHVRNVELVRAGLGDGTLPSNEFDVALLVTVLGEIPDPGSALREILRSLRTGGVLSITEVLPDPHYQSLARVRELASEAGFRETGIVRGWLSYTINLGKRSAA